MSARNIDLVTFENDSVLNQKSISLPIGKVSIRQTAILFSGILMTFLVFMTTDNLIMSGLIFAVFLGLGLIGSRVMAADQMIKSHLMLLAKGTSLDVKHEYMEKKNKKQQQPTDNNATRNSKQQQEESQKNNNGLVNKALSEIQSLLLLLFKKKDTQQKEQSENDRLQENDTQNPSKDKRFSGEIELTDQNILNVSLYKKTKQNQNDDDDDGSNPVKKMIMGLSKKQTFTESHKENIVEHVIITLDGKKLEQSQYAIKSDDIISLVLEKSPDVIYQVTATADDDGNGQTVTV